MRAPSVKNLVSTLNIARVIRAVWACEGDDVECIEYKLEALAESGRVKTEEEVY